MRVLQINSVCGIGSTGRIATDIHNILIGLGHESYIAYGRDIPKNCDTAIRIGTKYDNYAHVALTRVYDKHGFGSKKATKEFLQKVEKINPDVIHLHNLHGYYINIEMLFHYLKSANKPVIWTLHDCWAFTGHCAYFDYAGCDKWKTQCINCPEKNSYPNSWSIDNSKDNFWKKREIFNGVKNLTLITPSKWLAGLVKKSFLSQYPVRVINNGIDLDIFKPTESDFRQKYDLADKYIILGVASTWDRRKGLKYFIDLSKTIESDEVIVLVGLTEKQIEDLPKNIIGITRTNNVEELVGIYSSVNLFVNPTLEDNFPTTNLEALACGTPIITFNTGGSVESVNSVTGIVVEKGDLNELRDKIYSIKYQQKILDKNKILKRVRSLYDKNDLYHKYLDLYENVKTNNFLEIDS